MTVHLVFFGWIGWKSFFHALIQNFMSVFVYVRWLRARARSPPRITRNEKAYWQNSPKIQFLFLSVSLFFLLIHLVHLFSVAGSYSILLLTVIHFNILRNITCLCAVRVSVLCLCFFFLLSCLFCCWTVVDLVVFFYGCFCLSIFFSFYYYWYIYRGHSIEIESKYAHFFTFQFKLFFWTDDVAVFSIEFSPFCLVYFGLVWFTSVLRGLFSYAPWAVGVLWDASVSDTYKILSIQTYTHVFVPKPSIDALNGKCMSAFCVATIKIKVQPAIQHALVSPLAMECKCMC